MHDRLVHIGLFSHIQGFFARLHRDELMASCKFLSLLAVLALLPGRELDSLFGLNLQLVWLVVVFIAGLSFLGYVLSRVIDPTVAIGITGAIGGCISPGLAILSLAEQTRRHPPFDLAYALAAAIVSTIAFPRMLIIVSILSLELGLSLLIPFVAMTGVSIAVTVFLWLRIRDHASPAINLETPFRVQPALVLGAVVALGLMAANVLGLAIPTTLARSGIVLAVLADLVMVIGVSWAAGAKKMAGIIAAILLCSASVGMALVALGV